MNKVWEYVIDIFVGIIIMFLSVAVYFSIRTETVMKSMYENETENFITNIKNSGILTLDDYERYMESMGTGGNLFNIDYEHRYNILEPEYRFKTLEEILEEQNKAYEGSNDYHYREVETEIPHVDDPINNGNLNTETNESVLAKAVNTPADPNHVHGPECYAGHRHSGDTMFTHTHTHNNSCRPWEVTRWAHFTCNNCGKKGVSFLAAWYWDEAANGPKFAESITPVCGSCNSTSLRDMTYKSNYLYSCGYDGIDLDKDGYTDIVGNENAYPYKKPFPQDTNRATYISGCYTYHKTKYMDFNLNDDTSIRRAFSTLMNTDNFQGYCKIPEYITLGISTDAYLRDADIEDRPDLCRVVYQAYVAGNKQIRFKFSSYAYTDSSFRWVNGTDNPGFPADISVAQLKSYNSNTPAINNWFKTFFRRDYYNVNNGDISFHLHWMDRRWNGNEYMSWLEDKTVYLDTCDFDHSMGADKWIHTCGLEEDNTIACNHIIVSLTPTHSKQTVYTNDPLITTAEAVYQDGSKKTVVCTTDFSTSTNGNNKTATLTYQNIIKSNKASLVATNGIDIYHSRNGETWNKVYSGTSSDSIEEITYGNDMFIATTRNSSIFLSQDGISWQKLIVNISGQNMALPKITYVNGYFYALAFPFSSSRTCFILRSSNGTDWKEEQTLYSYADRVPAGIGYSIDKGSQTAYLYAVTDIFYMEYKINSDGSLQTPSSPVSINIISGFHQVGNNIVLNNYIQGENRYHARIISKNGTYYYNNTLMECLQYGNGIILHVDGTNVKKSTTLPDFTVVNNHNLGIPKNGRSNMIYFGDRFVFSGRNGNDFRIYSSPDGIAWTSAVTPVMFTKIACNAEGGSGEITGGTSEIIQTKTCTVTVNVIPRNKVCHKGHTYNLNDDGSDPGCPYCRAWVESLRVIHPATLPIVITIGTTLQDNGVTLLATYMDGHTEEVSSGYADNLDKGYLGTKPVTIGYKGASVTVMVTTIRATMICDICGYEYSLYPDGTTPGCPRCIQKIPVFTGNIMVYEHINHTEEILKELYDKGRYRFNLEDVFNISVTNKSSNIARKLLRKVYPSLTDRWFTVNKSEHVMSK